jgi:CsoR family transcriptional regulator, copper-sensing transcriptional repressor
MKDRKQEALQRLARLEGQVRGIARMIEQDRYCIDILNQALAVRAALSQVELLIPQDHADDCMVDAIVASDPEEQRQKFRELVDVFEKVCRQAFRSRARYRDGTRPARSRFSGS